MKQIFTVDGKPVGKGRPRFTQSGAVYTPGKTRDYEEYVRQNYMVQCHSFSFGKSPVSVSIEAYMEPLSKFNKQQRADALEQKIIPTSKPDADNIIKIVLDALNGVAFDDDRYIYDLHLIKFYSESPRIEVMITDEVTY